MERITLRAVADGVGYDPSYVCRVLRKDIPPSYRLFKGLVGFFGCSADVLLTFFNDPKAPAGISGLRRSIRRAALTSR